MWKCIHLKIISHEKETRFKKLNGNLTLILDIVLSSDASFVKTFLGASLFKLHMYIGCNWKK